MEKKVCQSLFGGHREKFDEPWREVRRVCGLPELRIPVLDFGYREARGRQGRMPEVRARNHRKIGCSRTFPFGRHLRVAVAAWANKCFEKTLRGCRETGSSLNARGCPLAALRPEFGERKPCDCFPASIWRTILANGRGGDSPPCDTCLGELGAVFARCASSRSDAGRRRECPHSCPRPRKLPQAEAVCRPRRPCFALVASKPARTFRSSRYPALAN